MWTFIDDFLDTWVHESILFNLYLHLFMVGDPGFMGEIFNTCRKNEKVKNTIGHTQS